MLRRVLIISGAGEKAFCAGADLKGLEHDSVLKSKENLEDYAELCLTFNALKTPSIAMIRGYALAGGCGLAMLPTFSITSENAKFGTPEINVGLIESFLDQDIWDGLSRWTPEKGTPQGAVISPLLANLYLHPVDEAMEATGYQMIRYADDFVMMCRDEAEANKALHAVQQLIAKRGLVMHPEKTRVVDTTITGQGFDCFRQSNFMICGNVKL